MPRFSANLSMLFTELPFLERFDAAADAGFDAVEFLFPYEFPPEAIRGRLEARGLALVLHNLPAGNWAAGERGLACHPDRIVEFHAGVAAAIRYARALGVPRLNCLAGVTPAGADSSLVHRTLVANLRFAAARLADVGIELLVEAINTRDMPGFHLETTSQALALHTDVAAPNLRLQFDAYHSAMMGEDPVAMIRAHAALIGHVQIADLPGRHEPGSGALDFAALFRELDLANYRGAVGCEYRPAQGTVAGLGWIERISGRALARSNDREPRTANPVS